MTVLEDRIAMAESDNTSMLDEMFERLEKMPVPEGYKVEIVEGTVYMSPHRDTHWQIILDIVEQLRTKYPASASSPTCASTTRGTSMASRPM